MTATQPDSPRLTRRGLLRTTAVGVGAAAGVGALGSTARPATAIDWGSVGKTAALAAVSPPVALGWALREYEVLGSDSPAEGLTASALKQDAYETARTRQSTNASTIVDNQNILDGVENNAYTEAKIDAIEELNAGSSESAVLDAAQAAVDSYLLTIEKNMLKSWNESVREFYATRSTLQSHNDVAVTDVFTSDVYGTRNTDDANFGGWYDKITNTVTLIDGSNFDVDGLHAEGNRPDYSNYPLKADIVADRNGEPVDFNVVASSPSGGDDVVYNVIADWRALYDELYTVYNAVSDGISTWVTNVYSDVQSGEIEITELITPRERAAMLSDDESEAQAIADLAALNIPIDPEREVTVTISETGATLSGTIGLTDESDGPIESGTTYDPSTFTGDIYLTADVSQLSGTWNAYETGVDGGTITLTAQPYEGTVLNVATTAGETVSVPAADWTDNGDGT
ncbi:hypothetical protein ACOJIV_28080 [Haloarcula sp. AONF1]